MPDQPLPNDPRFGFFDERPDQRLSDDEDPPRLPTTYATRQDYELDELERVTAENERLRSLLDAGIQYTQAAIKKVPPYEPGDDFLPPDVVRGTFIRILEMLTTDDPPYKQASQLANARQALAEVYESVPVFMQARLDKLRAILEGEA